MIQFGIVTPTYKRAKFVPRFIRNLRRQTYSNWTLVIVHDGPADRCLADVVRKAAASDARIAYFETPTHNGDWGNTPRVLGLQKLIGLNPYIRYVLLWDDDNEFYRHALSDIKRAIELSGFPDLLLIPEKVKWRRFPEDVTSVRNIPLGKVDSANLCIKVETALSHYPRPEKSSNPYFWDHQFYRAICDDNSSTVCLADMDYIGRYDGLRPWEKVRWTLFPWPLHIHDNAFLRVMRRMDPRGRKARPRVSASVGQGKR